MARVVPAWLPNVISFFRVVLVPVWVCLAEYANRALEADPTAAHTAYAPMIVLLVIGVSDVADGWIARRFRLQSKLGATLDAVADKLAQVVLLTYLAARSGPAFPSVPLWFLGLLVARDLLLLVGYLSLRRRWGSVDTEHRPHGKVSSLLLFAMLFSYCAGAPPGVRVPLLALSTIGLVTSTALYTGKGIREFRRGA